MKTKNNPSILLKLYLAYLLISSLAGLYFSYKVFSVYYSYWAKTPGYGYAEFIFYLSPFIVAVLGIHGIYLSYKAKKFGIFLIGVQLFGLQLFVFIERKLLEMGKLPVPTTSWSNFIADLVIILVLIFLFDSSFRQKSFSYRIYHKILPTRKA